MRVAYLSKALVTAAYRAKLTALACHVDVAALVPDRWGSAPVEPVRAGEHPVQFLPAWLHGHNHLHVYHGLRRALDRLRPDLLHIDEEPYSAVTLQAATLARRRAIPCLFFSWQNLDKRLPPPFGLLRRHVFVRVNGGIAGTAAAARVLRARGFSGPLAVIPQFGVDPDRFRPDALARARSRAALGIPQSAFVVGFGGRLVREKGVDLLVRAVAATPGAWLLLAGAGPERPALERLAAQLGVRLVATGQLPSTRMPPFLAGLDVLALPSRATASWAEQFGRILVEAMACGIPVVASRSGEIPEVVGEAGLLIPEGDAAALAAVLARLADEPAAREALGRAGRARVLDRFTHRRVVADSVEFYERLLDRRRP